MEQALYFCSELDMNDIDALIELIEKGDAAVILAEKNLSGILNELLKYELIDCRDGKIILTEKGLDAKQQGFAVVLQQLQQGKESPKTETVIAPARKFPFGFVLAVLLTFLSMVGYLLLHTLEIV